MAGRARTRKKMGIPAGSGISVRQAGQEGHRSRRRKPAKARKMILGPGATASDRAEARSRGKRVRTGAAPGLTRAQAEALKQRVQRLVQEGVLPKKGMGEAMRYYDSLVRAPRKRSGGRSHRVTGSSRSDFAAAKRAGLVKVGARYTSNPDNWDWTDKPGRKRMVKPAPKRAKTRTARSRRR